MRVLVFGDSITQGFSDPTGGWFQHLAAPYMQKLLDDPDGPSPDFFNLGVSADTSQNVCDRFEAETRARKRKHELVFVFAVGVNDACITKGIPQATPEQYQQNIVRLVKMAQEFSHKMLFVGLTPCDESKTTPCSWGDYVYKNEDVKKLDDILAKVCVEQNVPYMPVRDLFVGKEKELLPDGLHPNTKGHRLIADQIRPKLDQLLLG
jgi:acyl-CoA thioesterase I